jgi:hypothetical protein
MNVKTNIVMNPSKIKLKSPNIESRARLTETETSKQNKLRQIQILQTFIIHTILTNLQCHQTNVTHIFYLR